MALGTDEQMNRRAASDVYQNQAVGLPYKTIIAPSTPDGGVITAAIQQDDLAENIFITSTLGLGLHNELVSFPKL